MNPTLKWTWPSRVAELKRERTRLLELAESVVRSYGTCNGEIDVNASAFYALRTYVGELTDRGDPTRD